MLQLLPTRPLGSTGLQVSVLGYGASPLGGVFNVIDEAEALRSVHRAFELGVNYFDTSPFYGATASETVLGRALKGLPREKVVLATKVGRYGAETFDFSAKTVTNSVLESLQRLQTSYIDVIQTHDIEFGDLEQVVTETLPALQQLKQQGLVKWIGITGLPLNIYRYVLDRVPAGSVDMILSYCHYTIFDKTLEDLIPFCSEKGVGVVNASPLCMGLLTPQGPPSWHPAPQQLKDVASRAAQYASSKGCNIARLGIMDAVKNDKICSTLVGMPSCQQVEDNVNSVLQALGLQQNEDADGEAEVLHHVKAMFEPYMGTTWPSGRPENN